MTKNDNTDKIIERLKEIKEYIKNQRNIDMSISAITIFLGFAMNMGEFQIYVLENQNLENRKLSSTELLEEFLNQTSNEEILVLYDILDNTNVKNIENIKRKMP